jgi:cobalt-zinc-cadmium efflux system membrane fusion protein
MRLAPNSMKTPLFSFLGLCVKWVPNALVLCLLVALAYWGHEHHWKIPKFSQLVDNGEEANADAAVPGSEAATAGAQRHEVRYAPTTDAAVEGEAAEAARDERLPVVRFDSTDVVLTAGIRFAVAEQRLMEQSVVAHGVVDYDQTRLARLSTRLPGIVWRVERRVGEQVKKGDVLALIDSAEVGRAKAQFLEALVQCDLKEQTVNRLRSLMDVVSGRRLREAEADWRAARIGLVNARQRLITMGLPIDIDEGSPLVVEELVARVQFLGLPDSIVRSIQSDVQSSNLIPLVSPLDGVVVRRDVMRGEMAEPSQTLFVVADVTRMWLRLNVRAEDVSVLAIGQDVLFSTDGVAEDIHGTLAWIDTEVDPKTRTVRAMASTENPVVSPGLDGIAGLRLLQANAYGAARVRVRAKPQALAVPSSAVRWLWNGSHHVVFVPCDDGTSFQPRRVRPGIARDGYTEILEGLNPGEPVVAAGARLLAIELADAMLDAGSYKPDAEPDAVADASDEVAGALEQAAVGTVP